VTGDTTCAHRVMKNHFDGYRGKKKRVGYCRVKKIELTWRHNCSSSCEDYSPKDPTSRQQLTLEA